MNELSKKKNRDCNRQKYKDFKQAKAEKEMRTSESMSHGHKNREIKVWSIRIREQELQTRRLKTNEINKKI
jgi:hypothetical protein